MAERKDGAACQTLTVFCTNTPGERQPLFRVIGIWGTGRKAAQGSEKALSGKSLMPWGGERT